MESRKRRAAENAYTNINSHLRLNGKPVVQVKKRDGMISIKKGRERGGEVLG